MGARVGHDEWVRRITGAAASGEPLVAVATTPRAPQDVAARDERLVIPSVALRVALIALTRHGEAVDPQGLEIRDATFEGALDLSWMTVPFPLRLVGCRLTDAISADHSHLAQLELPGCACTALVLDEAQVDGSVDVTGLVVNVGVSAYRARITGRLTLESAQLTSTDGQALNLAGAQLGAALCGGLTAVGQIQAAGARVTGNLDLEGATLRNPGGNALTLDGAQVGGDAFCDGLTVEGGFGAIDARVAGELQLRGATLTNLDGDALNADRAQVGYVFGQGLTAKGRVSAAGARITGDLALGDATLTNPGGDALNLYRAQVGDVFGQGLTANGGVSAAGANIGELALGGANLTNPGGQALTLDRAQLGSAFCDALIAEGEVSAIGAHVAGNLDLKGATLTNRGGLALTLDGAQIGGDVFCRSVIAEGEVSAIGAHITGDLVLEGATLATPGGRALTVDVAQMGTALCACLTAMGEVSANYADMGIGFDLTHATLTNPDGNALTMEGVHVGRLALTQTDVEGGTFLEAAEIDVLEMDHALTGPLLARGWKVGDVQGDIRDDWRLLRTWLDTAGPKFTSQPWHELAGVFDRAGQPSAARRLRYAAAQRTTTYAPWYAKAPRWMYGATVGHGYYPLVAGLWIILVAGAGLIVTAGWPGPHSFGPTDVTKAVDAATLQSDPDAPAPTGATPCSDLAPGYPCFEPVLYAVGVAVPIAVTQPPAWRPVDPGAAAAVGTLRVWGWVLTALLLGGFTNLLRKT